MRTKPVACGKKRVVQLLLKFFGEQLGELVFKAGALLVGERKVAGIRADPQNLWIDQLER